MWRTRWMARVAERGEAPHPPVLIVFNHIGARDPNRTVARLQELARPLWAGEPADGFSSYDRKIPILATGLRDLRPARLSAPCNCVRVSRAALAGVGAAFNSSRASDRQSPFFQASPAV
ncbi:hypothetical protein [Streptomyces sp. NPDC090036]|uniref:hypothetical protein n=1 Tax=Streptomyces sp. NPDC090036 TaxID=3365926 RepID=UPI00380175BB